MKKISLAVLLISLSATAANALPSYLVKDGKSAYNVTYNYTDKPKNDWYVTFRAEASLLNWENKYNSDYPDTDIDFSSDKYSMEPVFGGSVAVGKKFGYWWRGEIEAGYTGSFTDKDAGIEFDMSVPYVMVNGMYDFENGLYLGAGLGVAVPMITMEGDIFVAGDSTATNISPMLGLMFGYTHKLDDNFVLDLRYRLAGISGGKLTRSFETTLGNEYYLETKVDLVLENSLSVGIRYEF